MRTVRCFVAMLGVLHLPACGELRSPGPAPEAKALGTWSAPIELPTHPEQMAVLPSGKVLMWPWAPERKTPPHGPLALWDPVNEQGVTYPGSGIESASGIAFQPDGKLLSAGGDLPEGGVNGNPRSFVFDHREETLIEVPPMNWGRVGPGATTLANGDILLVGGWGGVHGEIVRTPELWDGEGWTALPRSRNEQSGIGTFLFLAPDGRVFRAGPEPFSDWLDVTTGEWTTVAPEARNQIRHHGAAVMYEPGKILLAGGCPVGPEDGWFHQCDGTVLDSAEVIDLNDPEPRWRSVAPLPTPRHSHHATLLPDGRVLITGGSDRPGLFHEEDAGLLSAAVWDPVTERFEAVASMARPHHFQSTAVLLPDARVLVAGGRFGEPEADPHFAWYGQVYAPDYLARGPRPTIVAAPGAVRYGQPIQVETDAPGAITSVVLMGLSASRMGWNAGQRRVVLSFERRSGAIVGTAPTDPRAAPPGFYLLFLLNDQGVPSLGRALQITAS